MNFLPLLIMFLSTVKKSFSLSSSFTSNELRQSIRRNPYNGRRTFSRQTIVMMPEGPEVKTLVDQLQFAVGLRLTNIEFISGRYTRHEKPKGFEHFRETMTNPDINIDENKNIDIIQDWNCKGKFIWLSLDDGLKKNSIKNGGDDSKRSIWITLGMSGRFVKEGYPIRSQPRWYFEFYDEVNKEKKKIYYHDTRNFGTLRFSTSEKELADKLKSLGPDILENCSEESFMEILRKTRQSVNICKFLMNQKKICGVGNYLLSEALYISMIDPFASLNEISDEQASTLYEAIIDTSYRSYMSQGLTRKGGSYKDVDGNDGKFLFSLQCYGQDFCPKGNKVIRETNGPHGRTIWYIEKQLFMPLSERISNSK